MQHVADRVASVRRGDFSRPANPREQGARRVAEQRTPDRPPGVLGSACVEPHQTGTDRLAGGVNRHRARPLSCAGQRAYALAGNLGENRSRQLAHRIPPRTRVLDRAATRRPVRFERPLVHGDHLAGERDDPDLQRTGAEIDRERIAVTQPRGRVVGHAGVGTACWASSSCAITERTKPSASTVSPPGTPP